MSSYYKAIKNMQNPLKHKKRVCWGENIREYTGYAVLV